MTTVQDAPASERPSGTKTLDALVIGTGVAGIYQLHQLRELGLNARAYDTASDVGGTWYWNRYPGAKFDSEAYIYQYLFDEELYKNWNWSRRFPGWEEIQRWLQYVTETLDLRKDMQFSTTITSAVFDEDRERWTVTTDTGEVIDTQYVIACTGMLSAPMTDVFPGQSDFQGQLVHTGRYPKGGIDFAGKRVGVIGIGATGIQVIQTVAKQEDLGHLTVFARTPQYVLPMKNPEYTEEDVAWYKSRFSRLKQTIPHTFTGFEYDFEHTWADLTTKQRRDVLEEIHADGSLKLWLASFAEIFFDPEISEEVSEFVREKMRTRLKDDRLCEILIPTDYGFGSHRVPLESDYLEVYHQDNVDLVGVRDNPIESLVPEGIRLADGTVHELDVIIMATGFDAGTGCLTRIDVRGRDGRSLKDDWFSDIRTMMGLAKHGYPNLLTTGVPLAPSAALCNMTTCLQQQTEWISNAIGYVKDRGKSVIEPTKEGEDAWVTHHDETAAPNLISQTTSWYVGSNVPGKPRRVLSYTGGVGDYRTRCEAEANAGYPGFDIH